MKVFDLNKIDEQIKADLATMVEYEGLPAGSVGQVQECAGKMLRLLSEYPTGIGLLALGMMGSAVQHFFEE